MKIKIWGARGTRPVSHEKFLKYGGNTSCFEISTDKDIVLFDAGTGIINYGNQFNEDGLKDINVFITHTHWDHIQGLPHFKPLYNSKNNIKIFGQGNNNFKFSEIIEKQMSHEYFPIQWENLQSSREIVEINDNEKIHINDMTIESIKANHTSSCLNYKLTYNNLSCAYITDNEWVKGNIEELIKFVKECDLLIVDTFFTDEEYYNDDLLSYREGWGHATWQQGVDLGLKSGAKKIIFSHHNQNKDDEKLAEIEIEVKKISDNISLAREGMVITL